MNARLWIVAFCALWFGAPTAAQNSDKPRQWALSDHLLEISGLAAASERSVFAHNDEFAIVYEIDIEDGGVKRAFALGDPTAQGDFEGVAVYEGRIYLVTSAGHIYEADIGDHRARKRFNVYDTGVGEFCEVEGLSLSPTPGEFFLLCKRPRGGKSDGRLSLYRWSLVDRRPETAPALSIPYKDFLPLSEREAFRPAGVEWDAASQRLMVISSRSHIVYSFDANGKFLHKNRLSPELHRQSEGLAIIASGAALVADEGNGRKRAGVITVYEDLP